jgi:transcriptional repressor NrdR
MKCPVCGYAGAAGQAEKATKVLDSRLTEDQKAVRRRRECLQCGARFTTYERAEPKALLVVKRDGRHEPFDREKILNGLIKACEKRPIPFADLQQLVNRVEERLRQMPGRQVPSVKIGEAVMAELRQLDEVAYVRFASVYRAFGDARGFVQEVETLKRTGKD